MSATIRRLARLLGRGQDNPDAHVHFHSGPGGHPAVCDDPRCSHPRLTV